MPEQANTELDPELSLQVDAVRAQYKRKIDRTYQSYAGSRGRRTWPETLAIAGRLEREGEAQVNAILSKAVTTSKANGSALAEDSLLKPDGSDQLGAVKGAETSAHSAESDPGVNGGIAGLVAGASDGEAGGKKAKPGRRSRKEAKADDPRRVTEESVSEIDADGAAVTVLSAVSLVVSLDDPSLQPANLTASANKLLKELVGNYRAAIHQVVKTGKLANPPGLGATKDQWKEAAHALFNLWMTRSIASQDAALERISQWEKSLTGSLQTQLHSLIFGVRSPERERLVEPYDFVFRRVRLEKARIAASLQREHDQFQETLQGALRKRVVSIDADASIPSEKRRSRKASPEDKDEGAAA